MSLNETKCGVVMYGPEEGVGFIVFGISVTVMQQYTYLGPPRTVDLDLNVIVQGIKEKATNAYLTGGHS